MFTKIERNNFIFYEERELIKHEYKFRKVMKLLGDYASSEFKMLPDDLRTQYSFMI